MHDPTLKSYESFKNWSANDFMVTPGREARYYDGEVGCDLRGKDVLEIGFGNGQFLNWAKQHGANVSGTEVNDEQLARAKHAGIPLLASNLPDNLPQHMYGFDLIVAFDVMEHLTVSQNASLLESVALMLKPGGRFIARFPNGQSPLGLLHQNGDLTHEVALSISIIKQLLVGRKLRLVRGGGQFRPYYGKPHQKLTQFCQYRLQDALIFGMQCVFNFRAPMASNIVIELSPEPGH
jgi:2-polyprenyl-3-methyl-5-hydroxy-6-metoxy-1,4-benzoquinol methylase